MIRLARVFLLVSTFLVMSVASNFASNFASAQTSSPNIIFILSDDQGWGDYSFMGHPHIQTPNLDRLAKESLTFTRGYVPDSLCRPSLATILSGLYPHQHGIVGNDPPLPKELVGVRGKPYADPRYIAARESYLSHVDRMPALPKVLKKKGYRSLQTGKWWEGHPSRGGFDEAMSHGDMTRGGRHGDIGLKIGREGMLPIDEFIGKTVRDGKPFFVWYAPIMPHTPHTPPERLLKKYSEKTPHLPVAKYWAMCEWFDETIGELRALLDKHHVAKNTMIVYVTDNGWINEEESSQYAPRSKRSPNEGGVRTPIMIHWPDHAQPRRDETHLASSIDLVPTVLAAAQITSDTALPGIDLLDDQKVAARNVLFGEIFEHDIVDQVDPQPSLMYRWVIEGNWKLIQPYAARFPDKKAELYDLAKDPHEKLDLSDQHKEQVQAMERLFDRQWVLK